MIKRIDQLLPRLFIALILLAPLSKYPSWGLPVYNFTSFRLGLYQLLALVFVVLSFLRLRGSGKLLSIQNRYTAGAVLVLALLAILNMFDAIDLGRSAVMTASFLFLLGVVVVARWFMREHPDALAKTQSMMLKAGIVYAGLSVVQLVVSTYVTSNRFTLLCNNCDGTVFGFPRVNVFAAEPLFWANALLPFFAVAIMSYVKNKSKLSAYSVVSLSIALALTFARGAFVAVGAMLVVCGIVVAVKFRESIKSYARMCGIALAGFLVGFILLVASAVAQHRSAPYIAYNTVRGMLSHLTLGTIDLPSKQNTLHATLKLTTPVQAQDEFVSKGLVAASTNERLSDAKLAQRALTLNSHTFFFGVGLGNLGPFVVHNVYAGAPDNLTVYIFYVLFVAEMGVIGLVSLLFIYAVAVKNTLQNIDLEKLTILLVLTGFLVQYVFFGSYINVVYIWLWLGTSLGLGVKSTIKHEPHHKKVRRSISKV